MATIKSQMALDDGMSRVLSKIVNGLNTTLDAFEQVQRASGSALDVANIEAARAGLAEAGAEVKAMEEYFRQAAEQEERLNNGVNQGASAMDGLLSKAASLAATYMSISALKGFATSSMEAADTQIGAQVQLRTVLDNMGATDVYGDMADTITGTALESTLTLNTAEAEGNYGAFAAGITGNPLELQVDTSNAMSAYDAITQKAAGIQSRGMFGDEAMIAGAAELATYFSDTEAILSMMDTLTNYAAGMSNGAAVDASAMVDYATNLGKIMSGSFDAMKDRGFEFTDTQKAIIDGTATEQQIIAGLGAEYLSLSSDMQAAAVIQSVINEGWSGMYEAMSGAPMGLIQQLNNALGDIQENVGAGIYPAVLDLVQTVQNSLPQINTAAMGLATVLGFGITLLTNLVGGAMAFGSAVSENWSWIEPIVWGIVAALGAYGAVLLAVNGAQMVHNALEAVSNGLKTVAAAHSAIKAGASLTEAAATNTATGAQIGLNAALLACPVTWVVIGVIALIAAVVGVIRYLDIFGAKSTSVFGTFMGVLNVAWQFIRNVGAGISAVFFACCSNVETAFHNTIANVQGWWYGLLSTALTVVEGICAALNKLPFVEFDYSGISAQADEFAAKSAEAYGSVKEYESIGDAWGSAWSDNWQADAFQAGAAWGDGIADKVGGFFDGMGYTPGSMDDLMEKYGGAYSPGTDSFAMDGLGGDVSDIAGNTGSMAKSLEISGEELEYLRDIAERDAINRFTTAEVKIDLTGMTNKIEGTTDIDGVIRELTDGFTEALVTAAEGVHA
ncbi:hypothetical protein [Flintibacter muris]|uniref:hypothetical protein n=1 Tax=Flintibacter muris TaxID=2941327 RepID=UPI00203FF4B0|nr:hypothetical protein [Flintibacter muris]